MKKFMNKYIKYTLVVAAFALSIVLSGYAHAAPAWGVGASPYLPLVQAQVCGVGGNGCNPAPTAYAPSISNVQPGDNVWIMFYYNNIGTGTATNAKVTLSPQSTGVVTSQTFTGTLSASNTSSVSGSATVNLAQGQTLTYLSSKVYAHNGVLLSTTQGTEIFGNGLTIGDVQDSSTCPSSDLFCKQGVVVVSYKVGNTTPQTQTCSITQFNANPNVVTSGGSSTVTWSTSGCTSAIVQGGLVYVNALNGSQNTGSLYGTTTYTITAYGSNGSPVTQSTTVSVNNIQQSCSIGYFNANPTFVPYGGTTNLTWGTTGATSVMISGLTNNFNQSLSGSVTTNPIYGNQTYTLTAYCQNGGSQTQTITVSTTQQQACMINSFYASPSQVTSGSSTTLYWTTTGATSVAVSGLNNFYNQPLSGSASTGAIYGSQTYTLTAYCQNGGMTQVQSLSVGTTAPIQATEVFTGVPTLVTQTTARLNGNLLQSGNQATQVYFQWGSTPAYGFTTGTQNAGTATSVPFWNAITGLSANTTYYYRAVATNSSGTFYGDQRSFSTSPVTATPVPPTVITVTSGVGSGSNLVSLDINNNQQINACVANIVNYAVNYKNISGRTLNNVVLQVLLPQDVEFQSSNPGIYNSADHSVTLAIGTLIREQSGTVNITGVVMRSAVNRNLIVATATIAFTNPVNDSQESATAYGLGNTTNCVSNSLAGLAFWGTGFWPSTLIGWLILLLVLLLLVYLAAMLRRNYYRNPTVTNNFNGYAHRDNGNNGMRNNGTAQTPHYEDMDVPVYNNNQ